MLSQIHNFLLDRPLDYLHRVKATRKDHPLAKFAGITLADIQACLTYASASLKSEKIYAIPA
ncbi:hypothetical protein FJR05_04360 [Dolichospermum sp. UHCC 0259]|nr:hypothetical protein [Dolichospermum sp. UHCC 0259]